MSQLPPRILLDTNIFITGFLDPASDEAKLLELLANNATITLIYSNDLEQQLRRVGKRLQNSDWVGLLLHYIWQNHQVDYVYITPEAITEAESMTDIPREDIGIYLTAIQGQADCLVSGNREFVREAALKQQQFSCFNALTFLQKFPV